MEVVAVELDASSTTEAGLAGVVGKRWSRTHLDVLVAAGVMGDGRPSLWVLPLLSGEASGGQWAS